MVARHSRTRTTGRTPTSARTASTVSVPSFRIAISVGGDSDTLAAITGGIAEAYYGVPDDLAAQALAYLDDYLLAVYRAVTV
ncbi:MAG: hypothetical protein II896_07045 [Clostridia bacterium]|nr:hypothetical protein [Clostridia bacterium]